jgi:hypothetical protein
MIMRTDEQVVDEVAQYVHLTARFPQAPDWQAKVDELWRYCEDNKKEHLYKQGYELAKESLGL